MSAYKFLLRLILFRLDPEKTHDRVLKLVPLLAPLVKLLGRRNPSLKVELAGITFPSPVGLAAGFDKDLRCFRQMFSFGFGAVEVGTITPKPQDGNPKVRIERLPKHNAIVNRMGFPNIGLAKALVRLTAAKDAFGPVGVNIGANKDSLDRIQDYLVGYRAVAPFAHYVTVNVSSPNTPGLRALESGEGLRSLLEALDPEIEVQGTPVFLKYRPTLLTRRSTRLAQLCSNPELAL